MASKSIHITDTLKSIETGEIPCAYNKRTKEFVFDAIESETKNGLTSWTIKVSLYDGDDQIPIRKEYMTPPIKSLGRMKAKIIVESGLKTGKIRDVTPTFIFKGKNIGKKNETNVITQAIRDALTMYNKKKKTSTGFGSERPPPMLVKTNGDTVTATITEDDLDRGVIAQKKLNGVRLVSFMDGSDVIMYSRTGSTYPGLHNIRDELKELLKGNTIYLDGEIYKHGESLLWISGQSRRDEDDASLEYHVFDCFDLKRPELTAAERQKILDSILPTDIEHIKRVQNFYPQTLEDITTLKNEFVADEYEGIILRRSSGIYKFSYNGSRSSDIMRIKPKIHDEFECVGFTQGEKGKDRGAIVWICKGHKGGTFHVVPKNMTYETRYSLFRVLSTGSNFDILKGRKITVEFDEYSKKTGFPLRAKAETFRTYENGDDPMKKIMALI
jgi:ATP-dependent DNA ligase